MQGVQKVLNIFCLLTNLPSAFFSGFEITIDHPHTHVVKCTQLVRGKKSKTEDSKLIHVAVKDSTSGWHLYIRYINIHLSGIKVKVLA